jgi:Na+/proline symporter
MIVGTLTVLFWIYAPILPGEEKTLSSVIYEIVPGFILCGLTAIAVSLLGAPPPPEVVRTFEESEAERRAARR